MSAGREPMSFWVIVALLCVAGVALVIYALSEYL